MIPKEIFTKIKYLCKPLIKLKPGIKAIWLYGSLIRKKEFKKTSDIDIMILVDDTSSKVNNSFMRQVDIATKIISVAAYKHDLQLHFQPPRKLTNWWELIREGEPWTLTSIRDSKIVFDESGYIHQLKNLLEKGTIYSKQEKAEKLIERSYKELIQARQILLNDVPYELLLIQTETAQRVLTFYNKYPMTPKDVLRELKKAFFNDELISNTLIDDYEELYGIVKKINKGTLSEFLGRDLDRFYSKTLKFVKVMEEKYELLEEERIDKILLKSYKQVINLAKKAIITVTKKNVTNENELIKLFSEKLVKTNLLDEIHLETLKDLIIFKKTKDKSKIKKDRYIRNTYIKSFEIAISDYLYNLKKPKAKK